MSEFSGYAYPMGEGGAHTTRDLTKRELFAAMAMQGMLSAGDGEKMSFQRVASAAVGQADALLEALE